MVISALCAILLNYILAPLAVFPVSIQVGFKFITSFFIVYLCGRVLKWLWDAIPFI